MKTTKNAVGSAKPKKQSWMIDISGDGNLLIDPRDGEIVFVRQDFDHWHERHGFIDLERMSFEGSYGFDFTEFMEAGSEEDDEEDDTTWFCVDEAREVVMEIFAKLSVKKREALFEDCKYR